MNIFYHITFPSNFDSSLFYFLSIYFGLYLVFFIIVFLGKLLGIGLRVFFFFYLNCYSCKFPTKKCFISIAQIFLGFDFHSFWKKNLFFLQVYFFNRWYLVYPANIWIFLTYFLILNSHLVSWSSEILYMIPNYLKCSGIYSESVKWGEFKNIFTNIFMI